MVDGAGETIPDRNPFVKLVRKYVGAEELPVCLEGGIIILIFIGRIYDCCSLFL